MLKKEVAVQLMKHLVNHDWHGYSQYSRWGDGEGTCCIAVAGKVYHLEAGRPPGIAALRSFPHLKQQGLVVVVQRTPEISDHVW